MESGYFPRLASRAVRLLRPAGRAPPEPH